MQLGMELSPAGISDLIETLVEEYNKQIGDINAEIEEFNQREDIEETEKKLPLATSSLTHWEPYKACNALCTEICLGQI